MTPYQKALAAVQNGTANPPKVYYGTKQIDFLSYQFAAHKFALSVMANGMKLRGMKLSQLKNYYGIQGRTAKDVMEKFIPIMDEYMASKA
jgi:hypothetical protein